MTPLPKQYEYLLKEPGPKMLVEALRHYGELEVPGPKNNKSIMLWADELGLGKVYTSDLTAWCGLFMAICSVRTGYGMPDKPLWALNWAEWGEPATVAKLGYVLVFKRIVGGRLIGGHVAEYIGEDKTCYHIYGGNQGDKVGIVRILKTRTHAIRKPIYKIAEPKNVRVIMLNANGPISSNEA